MVSTRCSFVRDYSFYFYFYFLAQLAATKRELKSVREAAASGPIKVSSRIERPETIGNLQKSMGLMANTDIYVDFCVSLFSYEAIL